MNKKLNRAYIAQVAKKEICAKIDKHFKGNYHGSEVDRAVALMPKILQEDSQIGISFVKSIVDALNKMIENSKWNSDCGSFMATAEVDPVLKFSSTRIVKEHEIGISNAKFVRTLIKCGYRTVDAYGNESSPEIKEMLINAKSDKELLDLVLTLELGIKAEGIRFPHAGESYNTVIRPAAYYINLLRDRYDMYIKNAVEYLISKGVKQNLEKLAESLVDAAADELKMIPVSGFICTGSELFKMSQGGSDHDTDKHLWLVGSDADMYDGKIHYMVGIKSETATQGLLEANSYAEFIENVFVSGLTDMNVGKYVNKSSLVLEIVGTRGTDIFAKSCNIIRKNLEVKVDMSKQAYQRHFNIRDIHEDECSNDVVIALYEEFLNSNMSDSSILNYFVDILIIAPSLIGHIIDMAKAGPGTAFDPIGEMLKGIHSMRRKQYACIDFNIDDGTLTLSDAIRTGREYLRGEE
ncbi:hypothetical protein [Mogibacterium diversum]|uniref:hypothetical protein n=1 Tax=Mogibacterium diversum TaxID=114527 RepID=UPI0026ED3230|nr:hypothetical protein [Mogibacterium diversum]